MSKGNGKKRVRINKSDLEKVIGYIKSKREIADKNGPKARDEKMWKSYDTWISGLLNKLDLWDVKFPTTDKTNENTYREELDDIDDLTIEYNEIDRPLHENDYGADTKRRIRELVEMGDLPKITGYDPKDHCNPNGRRIGDYLIQDPDQFRISDY